MGLVLEFWTLNNRIILSVFCSGVVKIHPLLDYNFERAILNIWKHSQTCIINWDNWRKGKHLLFWVTMTSPNSF